MIDSRAQRSNRTQTISDLLKIPFYVFMIEIRDQRSNLTVTLLALLLLLVLLPCVVFRKDIVDRGGFGLEIWTIPGMFWFQNILVFSCCSNIRTDRLIRENLIFEKNRAMVPQCVSKNLLLLQDYRSLILWWNWVETTNLVGFWQPTNEISQCKCLEVWNQSKIQSKLCQQLVSQFLK